MLKLVFFFTHLYIVYSESKVVFVSDLFVLFVSVLRPPLVKLRPTLRSS